MRILNKRILRNFKHDWPKYAAVFLLFVFGLTLIISVSDATDSINYALTDLEKKSNVEDGNFTLFVPLNVQQEEQLKDNGVTLEKSFYIDSKDKNTKATVRIFKDRELMNLVQIKEGHKAEGENEIVLEQHYANIYSLNVGDQIKLDAGDYVISGIGYSIDYDSLLEQNDSAYPDSEKFATAFVQESKFDELKQNHKTEYLYSYLLEASYSKEKLFDWLTEMEFDENNISDIYMKEIVDDVNTDISDLCGGADEVVTGAKDIYDGIAEIHKNAESIPPVYEGTKKLLDSTDKLHKGAEDLSDAVYDLSDEYLKVNWENLITFTAKEDNRRIVDFRDFASTNKYCALPIGAGLFLVLAFLVAVIATNDIKRQSKTIGTLYAMGYNSNELTFHFMVLPVFVVGIACLIGTIAGFNSISLFTGDYVRNGCISDLPTAYPIYLILYGLVIPLALTIIVNFIVIKYTLSKPVLTMLQSSNLESQNIEISLPNFKFKLKYQLRILFREMSGYISLFVSLVMTIFMMVFGVVLFATLNNWVQGCDSDINYEYIRGFVYSCG